jgi:hypothetical protein
VRHDKTRGYHSHADLLTTRGHAVDHCLEFMGPRWVAGHADPGYFRGLVGYLLAEVLL